MQSQTCSIYLKLKKKQKPSSNLTKESLLYRFKMISLKNSLCKLFSASIIIWQSNTTTTLVPLISLSKKAQMLLSLKCYFQNITRRSKRVISNLKFSLLRCLLDLTFLIDKIRIASNLRFCSEISRKSTTSKEKIANCSSISGNM